MIRTIKLSAIILALSGMAGAATIEMRVNGLVCAFCAQGIEKTLRKNPATADVLVHLGTQLVAVQTHEGKDIADAELRKALTDAGYTLKSVQRTATPVARLRERLPK